MKTQKKYIPIRKLSLLSFLFFCILFYGCEDDETPVVTTIDLAAESITFSVAPTSEFDGIVTIAGTVKNLGGNYISAADQQSILLYEVPSGSTSGKVVAQKDFDNLNAGDTLQLSYSRSWSSSTEFPPNYLLTISYDPDIYLDDNISNDDSNSNNNTKEEMGSLINDLF